MSFLKLFSITLCFLLFSNISSYADYRYRYKTQGIILGEFENKNKPPVIRTNVINNPFKDETYFFTLDGFDVNGDKLFWSWSGEIPAGLSLNSTTGVISGTPTLEGVYNFTVFLDDKNSDKVSKNFRFSVIDCTVGEIGTECSDGAIFIGYNTSGKRTYMSPNDLPGLRSWGLMGVYLANTSISSAMNYNNGKTISNAMSPEYDDRNDGIRDGTAAMDCKNELSENWYLPAFNEIDLMKNARSSLSIEQQNTYSNEYYLTSSYNNNRNNYDDLSAMILVKQTILSGSKNSYRNQLFAVRCFRN